MGKKKFAKNAQDVRHFKLVSRSQYDPNAGDKDATPLVLEAFVKPNEPRRTGLSPEELVDIPESLHGVGAKVFGRGEAEEADDDEDVEAELEELDDDCYFPKDGYNYEKHLRVVSTAGKAKMEKAEAAASSVMMIEVDAARAKAAAVEADTLALARAKAKDLAPEVPGIKHGLEEEEVLAALDDVDEYEDIDDDELADLLGSGTAVNPALVIWGRNPDDDMPDIEAFKAAHQARLGLLGSDGDMPELDDDAAIQQMMAAAKAGAASRADAQVDPKEFEELMDNEYADEELGDLDEHEPEQGEIGEDELDGILDEYFEDKKNETKYLKALNDPRAGMSDTAPRMIEQTKAIVAMQYETLLEGEEDEQTNTELGEESTQGDDTDNFDCESVLSTLSNISNRPGRIGKIRIVKKPVAAVPASIKEGKEDEEEEEESEEEEIVELPDVITERTKEETIELPDGSTEVIRRNETPEEKKARKQSVKQMRKVCREMKKESKQVYKGEAAKLNKPGNNDVRSGLRTQKL